MITIIITTIIIIIIDIIIAVIIVIINNIFIKHHAKVDSERVVRLNEVGVNVTEVLVAECRNPDRTIKVG